MYLADNFRLTYIIFPEGGRYKPKNSRLFMYICQYTLVHKWWQFF